MGHTSGGERRCATNCTVARVTCPRRPQKPRSAPKTTRTPRACTASNMFAMFGAPWWGVGGCHVPCGVLTGACGMRGLDVVRCGGSSSGGMRCAALFKILYRAESVTTACPVIPRSFAEMISFRPFWRRAPGEPLWPLFFINTASMAKCAPWIWDPAASPTPRRNGPGLAPLGASRRWKSLHKGASRCV